MVVGFYFILFFLGKKVIHKLSPNDIFFYKGS